MPPTRKLDHRSRFPGRNRTLPPGTCIPLGRKEKGKQMNLVTQRSKAIKVHDWFFKQKNRAHGQVCHALLLFVDAISPFVWWTQHSESGHLLSIEDLN